MKQSNHTLLVYSEVVAAVVAVLVFASVIAAAVEVEVQLYWEMPSPLFQRQVLLLLLLRTA